MTLRPVIAVAVQFAAFLALGTTLQAKFVDWTASAGIDVVHNQSSRTLFGTMSGGAAAGDYNGDGWPDLYVTRIDATDSLYRNNGDGTFTDVIDSAFPELPAELSTNGPAWADIDNDDDLDLYLTNWGGTQNYLFINEGGVFSEQGVDREAAVFPGGRRTSSSATFGDYDNDGYLDLFVTEWQAFISPTSHSRLLRNRGAEAPGHFEDVTDSAGVAINSQPFTFAGRFTDLDQDGYLDLAISADYGNAQLFWNNGDGTFTDGTDASGANEDGSAMGNTVGDYDNDGDLDWFLGNINIDRNNLYVNQLMEGEPRKFADVAVSSGVGQTGWTWGSSFLDAENDGDLDLIVTNGAPMAEGTDWYHDPVYFFRNQGAAAGYQFQDESTDVFADRDTSIGSGLVVFDFDRDGDQDVFIVNAGAGQSSILYRNESDEMGDYLQLALRGVQANRYGLGAMIKVTPDTSAPDEFTIFEINGGSNFQGQNEMIAHVGLGQLSGMIDEIEITWPGGSVQRLQNIEPNQRLTVFEAIPEPATSWLLLSLACLLIPTRQKGDRSSY